MASFTLLQLIRTNGKLAVSGNSLVPLKLTYRVDGKEYELINDTQFMYPSFWYTDTYVEYSVMI